jgi:ribosome-binding protein aMBF1 (putative translation factor)
MKKKYEKNKKTDNIKVDKKNSTIKVYSLDEVFKKKTAEFKKGYREESLRIVLAHRIKSEREKQKLTQKTVAKRASMPQSVIVRLESGEHSISVDTLGRVANALGKQIDLVKYSV